MVLLAPNRVLQRGLEAEKGLGSVGLTESELMALRGTSASSHISYSGNSAAMIEDANLNCAVAEVKFFFSTAFYVTGFRSTVLQFRRGI